MLSKSAETKIRLGGSEFKRSISYFIRFCQGKSLGFSIVISQPNLHRKW